MKSNLIAMILSVLLALLLLCTMGAFLLLVPAVSLISVAAILLALIFMFALGCHAGGRRIRVSHVTRAIPHSGWSSRLADWWKKLPRKAAAN